MSAERNTTKGNSHHAEKTQDLGRQKATRELQDALYDAREQARHLRLGVQLHLGLWNERLEVFGITPRRRTKNIAVPRI